MCPWVCGSRVRHGHSTGQAHENGLDLSAVDSHVTPALLPDIVRRPSTVAGMARKCRPDDSTRESSYADYKHRSDQAIISWFIWSGVLAVACTSQILLFNSFWILLPGVVGYLPGLVAGNRADRAARAALALERHQTLLRRG